MLPATLRSRSPWAVTAAAAAFTMVGNLGVAYCHQTALREKAARFVMGLLLPKIDTPDLARDREDCEAMLTTSRVSTFPSPSSKEILWGEYTHREKSIIVTLPNSETRIVNVRIYETFDAPEEGVNTCLRIGGNQETIVTGAPHCMTLLAAAIKVRGSSCQPFRLIHLSFRDMTVSNGTPFHAARMEEYADIVFALLKHLKESNQPVQSMVMNSLGAASLIKLKDRPLDTIPKLIICDRWMTNLLHVGLHTQGYIKGTLLTTLATWSGNMFSPEDDLAQFFTQEGLDLSQWTFMSLTTPRDAYYSGVAAPDTAKLGRLDEKGASALSLVIESNHFTSHERADHGSPASRLTYMGEDITKGDLHIQKGMSAADIIMLAVLTRKPPTT